MDCFHDFCLACDRESTDGPYCSQTCRLADLERATPTTTTTLTGSPTSPCAPTHPQWTSQSSASYVLAPAYNFQDRSPYETHPRDPSRPQSSYFMRSPAQKAYDEAAAAATQQRPLTPSSSRSSLSSTSSSVAGASSYAAGMSAQAKVELRDYFSSFAQAKAANRRPSLR